VATVDEPPPQEKETPSGSKPAGPKPYRFAWVSPKHERNNAVAIAPWGDVLANNGSELRIYARHNGSVLEKADGCGGLNGALEFVDAKIALLVCERSIRELRFPGMVSRSVVSIGDPFDDGIRHAAICSTAVATANRKNHVTVYSRGSWTKIFEADIDNDVESLALSPDGTLLAIGTEEGGLAIYDINRGRSVAATPAGKRRVTALSFSPDGTEVFGAIGQHGPAAVNTKTGKVLRQYAKGRWLSTTRYVTRQLVVGAGYDGLSLFPAGSGKTQVMPLPEEGSTMEGVNASADGSMICGGDRSGRVACFSNRPLKPTGYQGAPELVGKPWKKQ